MLQKIKTKDGSHTLLNSELNEHYHSTHGAVQESRHVFIEAGLKLVELNKNEINILEVGMGTGLNVFLTFLETSAKVLRYTSLEAYPLEASLIAELNYVDVLGANEDRSVFEMIHRCEWGMERALKQDRFFTKLKCKLEEYDTDKLYDLIYFDAFAPGVQPELWTEDIFKKMYRSLREGGVLVTYCAKGEVKRNMKAAGFSIERLPGPPGKREMTRAVKMSLGH